jgi:hypothetical protein
MNHLRPTLFGGLFLLLLFPQGAPAKESVCVTCHSGLEETKALVQEYRSSVHFRNDISCHNCHGGNPKNEASAMDPASGFVGSPTEVEVPKFCGKCHAGVLDNYSKSAHGRLLGNGGPNCVTCHTAHRQQKVSVNLIDPQLCGSCHDYDRADRIRKAIESTDKRIEGLDHRANSLWARGFDVDAIKKRIFADRNLLHRQTHVIKVDQILGVTEEIQADLGRIEPEIAERQRTESVRKGMGAAVVSLFLLLSIALYGLKRQLVREYLGRRNGKS